jgi:hypothetical protein
MNAPHGLRPSVRRCRKSRAGRTTSITGVTTMTNTIHAYPSYVMDGCKLQAVLRYPEGTVEPVFPEVRIAAPATETDATRVRE